MLLVCFFFFNEEKSILWEFMKFQCVAVLYTAVYFVFAFKTQHFCIQFVISISFLIILKQFP